MKTKAEMEYQIIGDIYDAAVDPCLWSNVLQKIVEVGECNSAIITALDTLNPDYTFAFTHNIPKDALRTYREQQLDVLEMEVVGRPMIEKGVGSPILIEELYSSREEYIRRAGKFYELCFKPSNIYYAAATLLDHTDFRWAVIGIHRPEDWPAMTRESAAFVERMGLHIRRALQIHRQLIMAEQRNAQLYRVLDGLTTGVVLLNHMHKLRYANKRTEQLFAANKALAPCSHYGLKAIHPEQNVVLQKIISGAVETGLRTAAQVTSGVMKLYDQTAENPLMITVVPLSEMAGYQELKSDGIAAAVFITEVFQKSNLSRKLLTQSFGLTDRETELCQSFINCASLEGVADECGLTLSSTRTYIKEIFAKTEQHSQAELMRLLKGLKLDFEHIV